MWCCNVALVALALSELHNPHAVVLNCLTFYLKHMNLRVDEFPAQQSKIYAFALIVFNIKPRNTDTTWSEKRRAQQRH